MIIRYVEFIGYSCTEDGLPFSLIRFVVEIHND
jgi:hypothetical protein